MPAKRFTSEDWVLTKDLTEDRFIIETNSFTDIAHVYAPIPFDETDKTDYTGEWIANARLISKAPSMYYLLKRVQQMIVAENLMRKYVTGDASQAVDTLAKDISVLLRQVEEGGSSSTIRPRNSFDEME